MNAYNPTRPILRFTFAAVALAASLLSGALNELARGYSLNGQQASNPQPVLAAVAKR
jgi:hypothetical protein